MRHLLRGGGRGFKGCSSRLVHHVAAWLVDCPVIQKGSFNTGRLHKPYPPETKKRFVRSLILTQTISHLDTFSTQLSTDRVSKAHWDQTYTVYSRRSGFPKMSKFIIIICFCWQTASSLLFASVESSKTFFYKRSIRFPRLSTTSHTTVWSLTTLPMFTSPPLRVAFLQALVGCPAPSRRASTPPLTGATAYHSMQKELTVWNRAVNSSFINDS